MAQIILLAAIAIWLVMAGALLRAMWLFANWRPAIAQVRRSDYTEAQQWEDRWSLGNTWRTSRGFDWRDGDDMRYITDDVDFTDADGQRHCVQVRRHVVLGFSPSSVYTVWYDANDPGRVTAYGPLSLLFVAFVACGLLALTIRALLAAGGLAAAIAPGGPVW